MPSGHCPIRYASDSPQSLMGSLFTLYLWDFPSTDRHPTIMITLWESILIFNYESLVCVYRIRLLQKDEHSSSFGTVVRRTGVNVYIEPV